MRKLPARRLGVVETAAVELPEPVALHVRTRRLDDPGPLVRLLPTSSEPLLAWLRQGEGIVGWGEAARIEVTGADRFAIADQWWQEVCARATVDDEIRTPGKGLVTFGSFAFEDDPTSSVLIVPSVMVGRRGDSWWLTTIGVDDGGDLDIEQRRPLLPASPVSPGRVKFGTGALDDDEWQRRVIGAVERITAGDLDKVVLARDEIGVTEDPVDVRWPLSQLSDAYSTCWTFTVDGLFGATPEMLVRLQRGLVTSRVLAGTIRRTGDDTHDLALAGSLARSSKDLEEHEYAVRSVAEALAPHCDSVNVPEAPFVLHLPNVMHLATDVAGVLTEPVSSLGLAAALHPSAAVCGTPTKAARALIAEVEEMDRERYAGPVGWMDATGDGEWGIALRCGQIDANDARRVRLFAGCGIVADSDPSVELIESRAKLIPVREALECGQVAEAAGQSAS